jgi:hypothetical protein
MERFVFLPGGKSLFDPGLQIAGRLKRMAGSRVARRFAAIWSAWRPAAKSPTNEATTLPTSAAVCGDTGVVWLD